MEEAKSDKQAEFDQAADHIISGNIIAGGNADQQNHALHIRNKVQDVYKRQTMGRVISFSSDIRRSVTLPPLSWLWAIRCV